MAFTVYYFPDEDGAAVTAANGTAGQNPFPAGGIQNTGGYTRVVADSDNPGVFQVVFNYDSATAAPIYDTTEATSFSDANHSETTDGTFDYIVSNGPYNTSQQYTFTTTGTFQPNASTQTAPPPVSATETFAHNYSLSQNAENPGVFQVGTHDYGSYKIQDYKDASSNDNLSQLGDIANDHFIVTGADPTVNPSAFSDTYVGKTSGGGVIAKDSSGNYYLYTNNTYASGGNITAQSGVFDIMCFASGTSIRTQQGDVAIEKLAVGDTVITASGVFRPIRWLGHRTIDFRSHAGRPEVMPVRIAAHAFGENRPARDLFVSPGHAIAVDVVDEVLIPAGSLVNGSTIQQIEVDTVTYWHVELDSHDVILAENLPAESYLDMGNRGFFSETNIVDLVAGPDGNPALRTHDDFCRPYHAAGSLVDVVRAQVAKRAAAAGWALTDTVEMHLEVDGTRIAPAMRGLVARFHVPADAKDVWLVSPTARPCDTVGSGDFRALGLCLGGLQVDDGFNHRDIALDDPRLCVGFHAVEKGAHRWTAGRAKLPAALWAGCADGFDVRVQLAGAPVPRWMPPEIGARSKERPVDVCAKTAIFRAA